MTSSLARFIDDVLDDTVRDWMNDEDFDSARDRNECLSLGRLNACRQLAAALRQNVPPQQLRVNNLRGRCAEEQLIRRLCSRGFDNRNQVRIGPRRGGSVLDISPFPAARRRLPAGIESKHIHVADYRDASGRIRNAAILALVPGHLSQVRRHMTQSANSSVAGLPARVRLLYQLGGAMTPAEFRALAQGIYAQVRAGNAGFPPQLQVAASVVRAL